MQHVIRISLNIYNNTIVSIYNISKNIQKLTLKLLKVNYAFNICKLVCLINRSKNIKTTKIHDRKTACPLNGKLGKPI